MFRNSSKSINLYKNIYRLSSESEKVSFLGTAERFF